MIGKLSTHFLALLILLIVKVNFFMNFNLWILDNKVWANPNVSFNLLIYLIMKMIFNILSLSLPVPAGTFGPHLTFGAALGRTYGYFIK